MSTTGSKPEDRIRRLDEAEPRVESGPVRFGEDCPGVFIRADVSLIALRQLIERAQGDLESGSDPLRAGLTAWADTFLAWIQDCAAERLRMTVEPYEDDLRRIKEEGND